MTVYLHPRTPIPKGASPEQVYGPDVLGHDELAARYGADEKALARVRGFAEKNGLRVVEASAAKRSLRLDGSIELLNRVFGVDLLHFEHPEGRHRGHEGEVHLPADLHQDVVGVLGLDNRPMTRRSPKLEAKPESIGPKNVPQGVFKPQQVAEAYDFPTDLDGDGQCIGIIEMDGGFFSHEFEKYFAELGLPLPEICVVGPNQPGPKDQPKRENIEVAMDIQVAGCIAPKAKYVLYFAKENSAEGLNDIITTALTDRDNSPSILSVSWGWPEVAWAPHGPPQQDEPPLFRIVENNLHVAAATGVTVCMSSGDTGAVWTFPGRDGKPPERVIAPSFPASVPWVLSCGGTRLTAPGGRYKDEVAWGRLDEKGGATGGGVSVLFERPDYQADVGVPRVPDEHFRTGFEGRGVPDVAGDADAQTGYLLYANGEWCVHGGTSTVAPMWAALTAMINQRLGRRSGFLNEDLYKMQNRGVFRPITKGNNGYYDAKPGWNACCGLGSPIGSKLLDALVEAKTKA